MKKIKLIYIAKTGLYEPKIANLSKYDSYDLITRGEQSPKIKEAESCKYLEKFLDKTTAKKTNLIYCSRETRTFETAKLILSKYIKKDLEIISVKELNEAQFSLKELLSKEEYERFGSNLVRERFIEFFIADKLLESRQELKERIESIMTILKEGEINRYLLVSHSFTMKLLQIYLKHKDLFERPEKLRQYFDPTQRTFECGSGFSFVLR